MRTYDRSKEWALWAIFNRHECGVRRADCQLSPWIWRCAGFRGPFTAARRWAFRHAIAWTCRMQLWTRAYP